MILVIDTATATAVVALGSSERQVIATASWVAGYRHGEELLARVDRLLADHGAGLQAVDAVVVGTGPGAFTGLRVGLAVAKTLAHELGIPLAGISTAAALRDAVAGSGGAAPSGVVIVLPAGPSSRYVVDAQTAALVVDRSSLAIDPDAIVAAIDLDPAEFGDAARVRGDRAIAGLAASLLRLGLARLAAGPADDPALLVPDYVAVPRGAPATAGEVSWSRDRR